MRIVCFTSARASPAPRRSLRSSVTLAVSSATSVPPPMAMPRSAWASAGASLSPSPTMATRWPCSWYFRTTSSLRSGETCASTTSIPTWRATASAVSRRSPVSRTVCSPRSRRARMASALVARTGSVIASMPASAPSSATNTGVAASAACSDATASSSVVATPFACMKAALPMAMRRPATVPPMPRPTTMSRPDTWGRVLPTGTAESTASARGCSLACSTAAVRTMSVSRSTGEPRVSSTVVVRGRPSVTVPVLSSSTRSIFSPRSMASPPRTRMPSSAPRPVPTMTAVGTASPMAQGQAMMRTVTAATSALRRRGSGPAKYQAAAAARAMSTTTGTKIPATRSARRWMGALVSWASRTRRMMRASTESAPMRVARTRSAPVRLTVPPTTSSPVRRSMGSGSPVSIDSSMLPCPSTMVPSAAMDSPGRTRNSSPVMRLEMGSSSSPPVRTTRTVWGRSESRRSSAAEARPFARSSSHCPVTMSAMMPMTAS